MKKKFISIFAVMLALTCAFCFAFSAGADDDTDEYYRYVDGTLEVRDINHDDQWHQCVAVDSTDDLAEAGAYLRDQMIARATSISFYFATDTDAYNSKDENDWDDEADAIYAQLYNEALSTDNITDNYTMAHSGDYLEMNISQVSFNDCRKLAASYYGDYSYYYVSYEITYRTSDVQEAIVDEFMAKWQETFIDNNEFIQNSDLTVNEKNYYIVKTIYNFIATNALYDEAVNTGEITEESEDPADRQRYSNSHTAYGALLGNTVNSESIIDIDEYNWDTTTDSMGLCKIEEANQGLAVCDGYSLVTYYLCQLNGIDCRIIQGDYTEEDRSDPHAWNIVKLCQSDSDTYSTDEAQWYYYDATFSSTSPTTLKTIYYGDNNENILSIIDYTYFLRGTSNTAFGETTHQQMYSDYSDLFLAEIDENDYVLKSESISFDNAWAILTRRTDKDNYLVIENYFFISPDGTYYQISTENGIYELVECDSNITYNGYGYYYDLNIEDFVSGIEYTIESNFEDEDGNRYIKDVSSDEMYIKAVSADGNHNYTLTFNLTPLDMSDWSGYSSMLWNGDEIVDSSTATPQEVEFKAATISFSVDLYDVAGYNLVEGTDYEIIIIENDTGYAVTDPWEPGSYKIQIWFTSNNYDNSKPFEIYFNIVKGDFSEITVDSVEVTYGEDILANASYLDILADGETIVGRLYAGTDFTVTLADSTKVNYGDTGTLIYTALSGSKYLKEGTQLYRSYTIAYQWDASASYTDGQSIGSYSYTGSAITPSITIQGLTEGTDYKITSYSNNVNVGTAYMTVEFIGNYCGTVTFSFEIVASSGGGSSSSSGSTVIDGVTTVVDGGGSSSTTYVTSNVNINIQTEIEYTGSAITPTTTVTADGVTLTQGVDYTVSSVGPDAGVYTCTIQGLGNYSSLNATKAVFVTPAKVTGGTNSSSTTSTVTISWNSQGSQCSYEIYTYDAKKKKWVLVGTTNARSLKTNYSVSNGKKVKLTANTQYKFRVRAYYTATVDGVTTTKYGAYATITAVTKVSTPASPSTKKKSKTSLKVSWKKVTNASGYTIQYATNKKFTKNKKTVTVKKGKTTSTTLKKLKKGKTYYIRIRAYQTVNGKKVYSSYTKTIKVKM